MISYGKQSIDQSDIDAVVSVLKGDWLTQGTAVEEFENNLNKYFGSKYACAVSNGTAALHLIGLALGWEPGDVVITTSITFLATANCIVYAGATPDFVDIDPVTNGEDENAVKIDSGEIVGPHPQAQPPEHHLHDPSHGRGAESLTRGLERAEGSCQPQRHG